MPESTYYRNFAYYTKPDVLRLLHLYVTQLHFMRVETTVNALNLFVIHLFEIIGYISYLYIKVGYGSPKNAKSRHKMICNIYIL